VAAAGFAGLLSLAVLTSSTATGYDRCAADTSFARTTCHQAHDIWRQRVEWEKRAWDEYANRKASQRRLGACRAAMAETPEPVELPGISMPLWLIVAVPVVAAGVGILVGVLVE
jgi:hypothetical protein